MVDSLSSTSKSSGVSYLQIYKSWLKKDQQVNLQSTIPVETILTKLTIHQVLTQTEYEMINLEVTREQKLLKLFIDILPLKGEHGFNQLVKILFVNKCDGLANFLLMEKKKLSTEEMKETKTRDNDGGRNKTDSLSFMKNGPDESAFQAAVQQIPLCNIVDKLGSGTFGYVYKEQYQNETRAIKKFKDYDKDTVAALKKEFHLISRLEKHDNVVFYVDFIDNSVKQELYLIMEYVDGCTLKTYCNLDKTVKGLDLKKKLWISECCWAGLDYLHKNKILHSDISPNNILVSLEVSIVKICDFGFSKSKEVMMETFTSLQRNGTPLYRAPELVQKRRHPIKSDVFSMAATLCELFSETKFSNSTFEELVIFWDKQLSYGEAGNECVQQMECFTKIPKNVQEILKDAVSLQYKNRPKASILWERTKTARADMEKAKPLNENV